MKESQQIRFMDISSEQTEFLEKITEPIPSAIYIEPTNLCNFHCPFCPTGHPELLKNIQRPKGMMDIDLYKKIISDLKDMVIQTGKKINRIHLYKDGEPLLHKGFAHMVQLAKEAEIAESIETTTNAALLRHDIAQSVIDAGLDVIRISIESVEDNYYSLVSGGKTTYDQIRSNVEYLYSQKIQQSSSLHIHAKIIDTNLSKDQISSFVNDFDSISDSWNMNTVNKWPSCGIEGYDCLEVSDAGSKIVCTDPFTKIAFNYNGSVSVCCVDWSHGMIIGDASYRHVRDIWFGEELRKFRVRQLKGERSNIATCFSCSYVDGLPDIDEQRDKLLPLFQR